MLPFLSHELPKLIWFIYVHFSWFYGKLDKIKTGVNNMSLSLQSEANRCLQCKVARCHNACPIGTSIPQMIQLYKENKLDEAGELLYKNNPFSIVCSYVCNHQAQCVGNCILGIKFTPIPVNEIEKAIGAHVLDSMSQYYNKPVETNKRVAIIGGGPAGIASALLLSSLGVKSTIFEKQPKMGGVLRYGIPDFRLPHTIVDKYTEVLEDCDIEMKTNFVVNQEQFETIQAEFDAVILAIGVWEQKDLGIEGELNHSISGVDYLVSPEEYHLSGSVIVLGAGNSAIDVARVAKRSGAETVNIYARTNRIRASQHELDEAEMDGVKINKGMAPIKISQDGVTFEKKVYDDKNELVESIPMEVVFVEGQHTIVSINRGLDVNIKGLTLDKWNNIQVDESNLTSLENVYAVGDDVTGAKTVVDAVAKTREISREIAKQFGIDLSNR